MLANAGAVHSRRWAAAFAERGHRVTLLSIRPAEIPGVDVRTVRWGPERGAAWTLASYLRLAAGLRRRVGKIAPDVVHAHFTVTHGAMAAAAGLRPLVVTGWGSDVVDLSGPLGPLRRSLNRLALARADLATATSSFLAERMRALAPDGGATVHHLPWGVDCERFRPAERDPEADARPVVGFVKTLHPKYGPHHLIDALPTVLERLPAARLVLAGSGPQAAELERRAAALGVADRVELTGFVKHRRVPELMSRFDLLANPTVVEESFGIAPLEAAACGLPVVATRVGGVPEVVVDGETGLLVPPGDVAALAAAIVRLGSDRALARRMGRAGRLRAERHFAWGAAVDRMLAALERVAAGGSR